MKCTVPILIPLLGVVLALPFARADAPPPTCACSADQEVVGSPHAIAIEVSGVVNEGPPGAFLGVETETASPTLTEQLGLPSDTGLVVEHVVHDSAAASALKPHDILLKLDDQLLIDPRQLSVLVRSHKVGDTVSVVFLRGGKQETATIKLGRHEMPKISDWGGPGGEMFNARDREHMREDMDKVLSLMNGPAPWPLAPGEPRPPEPPVPPKMSEVSVDMANSNIVYTDDKGTLTLTIKDGKRTLVAVDAHGKQLFSGPINSPEDFRGLPPQVHDWLKGLHGLREFRFTMGRDFQGKPPQMAQPENQSMPLPPRLDQPPQPAF
jgi:hypothetical protein